MPGQLTATQMVAQLRNNIGEKNTGTYRDGFSTDSDTYVNLIPLLSFINQAATILFQTGIFQEELVFTTSAGSWRVSLSAPVGRITEVTVASGSYARPLRETTLDQVRGDDRDWRQNLSQPNAFMNMGNELWLTPVPSVTASGNIRYVSADPALVASSDVYPHLPYAYNDAVTHLAGILACVSDAASESKLARAQYLVNIFQMAYPDLAELVNVRSLLPGGPQLNRQEGGPPSASTT